MHIGQQIFQRAMKDAVDKQKNCFSKYWENVRKILE